MPPLESYAWRLWDYWERHLDPDLFVDRTLKGKVRNKVVVITGGSSGIGLSTAQRVAEAGAITVIVARGEEELFKARDEMKAKPAARSSPTPPTWPTWPTATGW